MRKTYLDWSKRVTEAFAPPATQNSSETKKKIDKRTFPYPPPEVCACEESSCWLRKQEKPLGACIHDVEMLLKGVGEETYGAGWLWRMSLGWHPDRFAKKFKEEFCEEGVSVVGEMFSIITELSLREREKEEKAKVEKVV